MYEGLPIATNKLPLVDRKSIPHHLLGCVKLDEEPWKVGRYVRTATKLVEDIVTRGKLPIVVGGTHYYTQSLLFENSIIDKDVPDYQTAEAQEDKWPILAASTKEMHDHLRIVDPEMASRWHPNDRRKIRHSLEVYLTSGRRPSDLYRQQRMGTPMDSEYQASSHELCDTKQVLVDAITPPLRFDPLILWTFADPDRLSVILDKRVDAMVEDGLIEEVASMEKSLQKQEQSGVCLDQSSGIWVAIGFKELVPYVTASAAGHISTERLEKMKKEGIELTKNATRQYAKQQLKWIRGKLLRALEESNALNRLILLDGTDLSKWHHNVEAIAHDAVSAFLNGRPMPSSARLSNTVSDILVPNADANIKARHCETCNITMMTQREWNDHPQTKKHRRATKTPIDWQALYPKSHSQGIGSQSGPRLLENW